MTFRQWTGLLSTTAGVLIFSGLLLGSIVSSVSIGYGDSASSLSCGAPWAPSSGNTITMSPTEFADCTAGFSSRALLGADAVGLGVVLLMGMGLVQMALTGRREASAAVASTDEPSDS